MSASLEESVGSRCRGSDMGIFLHHVRLMSITPVPAWIDSAPGSGPMLRRMEYSIAAFGRLAGVSVKTLRHYERLGLLVPRRTRARYRRYSVQDLQRLERVLALKTLGLSLNEVNALLDGRAVPLHEHRAALEAKRARLDRAIDAIHA